MVTFKVDGKVVKASEFRVEVELPDGDSIVVVLTNEGIITDCFGLPDEGEEGSDDGTVCLATSSIMYDERFDQMTQE